MPNQCLILLELQSRLNYYLLMLLARIKCNYKIQVFDTCVYFVKDHFPLLSFEIVCVGYLFEHF